ncbi:hypothetical protein B617_gp11 [Nonlabens phage P12024S]|uniref:Uncharacterized protein n=1 Tax=Nonlabens phage P12024S TaxID=1168478 RepID=I6S2C1_9CAUD|nr:hypothetical protein B617_gp11 [Nonlabens phage P12024S]AFM54672.1 hypothetical protein P12024S_11 [Nonlabens phage P12024S]
MNIYQLKYTDKQAAIFDLMDKGVLLKKLAYEDEPLRVTPNTKITKAVVWIGQIVDVPATEDTEATYIDGYHVDVMLTETRDFGSAETLPKTPAHKFAVK